MDITQAFTANFASMTSFFELVTTYGPAAILGLMVAGHVFRWRHFR